MFNYYLEAKVKFTRIVEEPNSNKLNVIPSEIKQLESVMIM